MNFNRIICAALIFCTIFSFVACTRKNTNIDDVFNELKISEKGSETESEALPFAEHIYVIISNQCSGELSVKAKELAQGIENKTGILTSLKYDSELTSTPKNSCEVVVGNTNRLASKNAMDILKKDEYLCRFDDGAIVICGRSDASTVVAVDRFINEMLPLASKYELMAKSMHFEFLSEYEVERILLNGYDLYDYVLTYPESNKNGEKNIAVTLRDFINFKSGYFLEVYSSNNVETKNRRTISLSGEGQENALVTNEKGIALIGVDAYSLSLVTEKFVKDITEGIKDRNLDLKYEGKIEVDFVDTSFESAFCFLKANSEVPFKPVSELLVLLSSGRLNICFIGNPNEDMRYDFSINLKNSMKTHEVLLGEREIMIVYDTNKVKKLDVCADENSKYIIATVETSFGEIISYVYILDGEIPKIDSNAVIFCENLSNLEVESSYCAARGEVELTDKNMSYLLTYKENLSLQNSDSVVQNDMNGFYCTVKMKLIYSNAFLNNTLK